MIFIWLIGLITLGLLVWFGMQVFSGGIGSAFEAANEDSSGSGSSGSGAAGSADGAHNSDSTSSAASDGDATSNNASSSAAADASVAGANANAASGASAASSSTASASSAAGAGTTAGAAGAAVAAAAGGITVSRSAPSYQSAANPIVYENVTSGADITASGNGASGHAAGVADAISTEDASSVREMIKILNLRESDASRLGIDQSQFASLWQGSTDAVDASTLSSVHSRLQSMLN